MKTYRKKQSVYILTYKHIQIELLYLYSELNEFFSKNKAEHLVKVRERLSSITEFVEKIPTYETEKERKKKFTAPIDYKVHLLSELTNISQRINSPLIGKDRVLQCADILETVKRLGVYNRTREVYFYESKAENLDLAYYQKKYAKCVKLFETG